MAGEGEAAAGWAQATAAWAQANATTVLTFILGCAQATAAWAQATATTVLTFILGCAQWAQATAAQVLNFFFGFVTILHVRWFGATMIVVTMVLFATTVLTFILGCARWAQATATQVLNFIFGFITILHVRWFGATMIVVTMVLFNVSAYMSSFEVKYRCILSFLLLLPGCVLFPFPRNLNLKQRLELKRSQWCNSIPYDVLRGFGSILCYYLFDLLGSCIQIQSDQNLMRATIPFYHFLIVIDLLYDIEDAFAVCDGYTFAGYGLMIKQTIVSQWFILPTCFFFCVLKNYVRSNRELILAEIERRGENLNEVLPTQRDDVTASEPRATELQVVRVMERQLSANTRVGSPSDELNF